MNVLCPDGQAARGYRRPYLGTGRYGPQYGRPSVRPVVWPPVFFEVASLLPGRQSSKRTASLQIGRYSSQRSQFCGIFHPPRQFGGLFFFTVVAGLTAVLWRLCFIFSRSVFRPVSQTELSRDAWAFYGRSAAAGYCINYQGYKFECRCLNTFICDIIFRCLWADMCENGR